MFTGGAVGQRFATQGDEDLRKVDGCASDSAVLGHLDVSDATFPVISPYVCLECALAYSLWPLWLHWISELSVCSPSPWWERGRWLRAVWSLARGGRGFLHF